MPPGQVKSFLSQKAFKKAEVRQDADVKQMFELKSYTVINAMGWGLGQVRKHWTVMDGDVPWPQGNGLSSVEARALVDLDDPQVADVYVALMPYL